MTELRIGTEVTGLRRQLGPVPWFVLEELLLGPGEQDRATFVADASARRLALTVSLDKDTVARAVSALARAGVVSVVEQAKYGGRFGAGGYRIAVPAGVQRLDAPNPSRRASTRPSFAARPSRTPIPTVQLALLELPAPTVTDAPDRASPKPPKRDDALAPGVPPPRLGTDLGSGPSRAITGRRPRC